MFVLKLSGIQIKLEIMEITKTIFQRHISEYFLKLISLETIK